MISIGDPGQPPPTGVLRPKRLLTLSFCDTVIASDPFGPAEEDVESVLAFAPTAQALGGTCLVHCHAGVSRSTAIGIVLLAAWLGSYAERRAAVRVRQLVPQATPNPLIIAHADACLHSQGMLRRAVAEVFRPTPPSVPCSFAV